MMFAEGLTHWLHGRRTFKAEAASYLVAETVLRARAWLEAQEKNK